MQKEIKEPLEPNDAACVDLATGKLRKYVTGPDSSRKPLGFVKEKLWPGETASINIATGAIRRAAATQ